MDVKQLVKDIKRLAKASEYMRVMHPELASNPEPIPGVEQLTYGPGGNNLSWNYSHGAGSWDFFALDKVNSDILLIYMSRMAQMYQVLKTANPGKALTRGFKRDLLIDKYPVFTVSKDWSV